ncbi:MULTISPECIES: hypothetical protein [unclassified Amycolatopsis]|uniref:hypothetical protein n=1 Tax=unclassified Amycolatopsis TaxID=2618356 RepID=UPI0028754F45|nr:MULTISPECIES: hypothetical protein [unclassified Amycolatopsis]MDS0140615.1 hypothetical protein [Amycolatopsis sp. 505]MDS0149265.1 hypothetical protein [Amycolatopsis sp. CM201R]
MGDQWAHVHLADEVHDTVESICDQFGGDVVEGDADKLAVRLSEGSDGVVIYGRRHQLAEFGRRLVDRYA